MDTDAIWKEPKLFLWNEINFKFVINYDIQLTITNS